jgi:hypothetical protein
MSVTNTQYATNTYKVVVANELIDSNNVIAGVNTAITTLGWSLYDSKDQTTYSPIVTRVYRVLNVDGLSYKYAILRYDTLRLRINLSTCESWNTSTKVPTNESWHADGCFFHGYDLRNSTIFVNATARHLLLQSWILGEPGHWAGIFEAERIANEDISANTAPNYFYTNSLMLGTPFGIESTGGTRVGNTSSVMVSFPRTPDNITDFGAAAIYAPMTSRGMWPPYYPSGNTGNTGANSVYSTANTDLNNLHLGSWWLNIGAGGSGPTSATPLPMGGIWGWDAGSIPLSPVSIDAIKKHMPFGRIYDVGITKPIGSTQLDSTFFTANTNGGWPETAAAGTSNTEFLLLPLNGGMEQYVSNNNATLPQPTVLNSGVVASWANNSNAVFSTLSVVGNNVFAAANNGIWVWNQGAGTNTAANVVYFNSNGVIDLMFDGKRSIYGTTNTGLIQLDTESFATNTITSTPMTDQGGCAYINMDQKFIYATNRTANTRPHCHIVYRSNNTVAPNTIQLAAGQALGNAAGWTTPMPDYNGFVYVSTSAGSSSVATNKRMLVANSEIGNDGVLNTITPWFASAAHVANNEIDNIYLEPFSNRLYHFLANTKPQATNTAYVIEYTNDRTLSIIANTITIGTGASFGMSPNSESIMAYFHATGASDQRGDLNIVQTRGMFQVQLKNPGRNINTATPTAISRFVLHHPSPNPSNSNKLAGLISKCFETANGVSAAVGSAASTDLKNPSNYSYTNGVRVYNTLYLGNTESRIQVQNNYFAMYAVGGYPTSRLLIKA